MLDLHSRDVETAAYLAYEEDARGWAWLDERLDAAREERGDAAAHDVAEPRRTRGAA
jgi:hypothetical protein